jgi:hypothetical protein
VFVNLCWEPVGPAFRDHNFDYFLEHLESRTEASVKAYFCARYRTNDWSPDFADAFEFTLSARACDSFLRLNPSVPIIPRDYYLSKIFQFASLSLVAAIEVAGAAPDDPWGNRERQVHCAFENLDDALLSHLPYFDWFSFQRDVWQSLLRDPELGDLNSLLAYPEHLPGGYLRTERIVHPSRIRDARQERRMALLASFRAVMPKGGSYASVYKTVKVHSRDFRRWQQGELPDTSKITIRLERAFREEIKAAVPTQSGD